MSKRCVWLATFVLFGSLAAATAQVAADTPTFASDIAPLLYGACTPCHRDGQPTPFSLLSYRDAVEKSAQIAEVTRLRRMPPWLPTHGDFVGDRRLSAAQIELLRRWVDAGTPRGDEAKEPPAPTFAGDWQLPRPHQVVRMPVAFDVPASGPDLVRNFVVPIDVDRLRFVEALEIRPVSAAVHHAILGVDATHESRRLDAADPEPGFPGMVPGAALPPDGHFLGWTPGKSVRRNPAGSAWRLRPGDDFVLQLHAVPTGKRERVQAEIAIWFTEQPTTVQFVPIVLFSEAIDIASGESDFVLRDHVDLPVPVTLQAIYPHAHYVCRRMRGTARLPNGDERVLFAIDGWDFDWQDDYRLREPLRLPAGTRVAIEYGYDNSEQNPNNPVRPRRRVRFGQGSNDEMGTLTMSVTLDRPADQAPLQMALVDRQLEKLPKAWNVWLHKARLERERGQFGFAQQAMQRAQQLAPEQATVWLEAGLCMEAQGQLDKAVEHYEAALQHDAALGLAHLQLGGIVARRGHAQEAIAHFATALQTLPNSAVAHNNFATASFQLDRLADAEQHYRRALALDPDYFSPQFNLGRVLVQLDRLDEARTALTRALQLRPADAAVTAALQALPH